MISSRLPLSLLLAAASVTFAAGQTLTFSDGRTASLATARVAGDTVWIPLQLTGGESGTTGLPLASVVKLDWPEPAELAQASTLLASGRAAEALALIDKTLPTHAPFKDIAGSWWADLMVMRVRALAKLGRDVDAEVGLGLLRRSKFGAEKASGAVLDIVSAMLDAGKTAQARGQLELSAPNAEDESVAARLAILRGRILFAENKPEEALLSFLRVRALYPRVAGQQAASLLGAAACYEKLGETARAQTARNQLRTRYPASPEAARLPR